MFTPTLRCECAQPAIDRLMRKWCIYWRQLNSSTGLSLAISIYWRQLTEFSTGNSYHLKRVWVLYWPLLPTEENLNPILAIAIYWRQLESITGHCYLLKTVGVQYVSLLSTGDNINLDHIIIYYLLKTVWVQYWQLVPTEEGFHPTDHWLIYWRQQPFP